MKEIFLKIKFKELGNMFDKMELFMKDTEKKGKNINEGKNIGQMELFMKEIM